MALSARVTSSRETPTRKPPRRNSPAPAARCSRPIARATANPSTRVYAISSYSDWLYWHRPDLRGRLAYDIRFEIYRRPTIQATADFVSMRGPDWAEFIAHMYGSQPDRWQDHLSGHERLRVIVNGLTRLRFCTPEGAMEFSHHGDVSNAPPGYQPWFDVQNRLTRDTTVAFGHWSSLSALNREDVIELDTGCVWGRCLSALKIDPVSGSREKIQVSCRETALTT
mgnify:CR=1 FL=1